MDFALGRGVNFFDAAEMYPVPPKAETQGRTEACIGSWFAARKNRDQVILATKVAGPSHMTWIRDGQTKFNRTHIRQALEGSLQRLQTDYVDLYQLHWPERHTNMFGQLGYTHDPHDQFTPLAETLDVLGELVAEGKIRYVGLSNETPWGAMQFLHLAEQVPSRPRMMSIQNPYSLLNRSYEVGLAEVSIREQIGLLAYSPLAFGVLSGKYLGGKRPEGARITLFPVFDRYSNEPSQQATERYVDIAKRHGLSPAQMALAFVTSRPFVTSNIIGATTLEQLRSNLASVSLELSPGLLEDIESIHCRHPNPSP